MWNWLVIFVATKVATMKTKPYGVRFNEDDLLLLENEMGVTSPQRAVNFLFQYWREHRVGGSLVSLDLWQEQVTGKDIGSMGALSEKSLPSAKDVIVSPIVISKGGGTKSEVLAGLRGIISDVMAKPIDDFVFPDGLDDIKVDYKKLYDGCELDGDYRDLWIRIKDDMNLSSKEKNAWKLTFGVR